TMIEVSIPQRLSSRAYCTFTRIVERRSFTEVAHDTGVPRFIVTTVIRQMEERLGVRLLQRTTRTVRPTLDGEAYY
ncbi:MAG TPA: LysR family transcriptional regulator, partial [Rhodopila sp.]|nr:LysR family transcriptional regulator [Rhodopila sp.]